MKFDVWGIKKNAAPKDRKHQKHMARKTQSSTATAPPERIGHQLQEVQITASTEQRSQPEPIPDVDPAAQRYFMANCGFELPAGHIDPDELLRLLSPANISPVCGLQALILKWQPGGAYLRAA